VGLWNNKIWGIVWWPLACVYRWIIFLRNQGFRLGILHQTRLSAKVISVGNITVGGTGKTPFVMYCAKILQKESLHTGVLIRGYGRTIKESIFLTGEEENLSPRMTGDEPALLARHLKDIPIAIGSNRIETGIRLCEEYGCEILLLDDGFQHRKLYRDLDVLLMDASNPWGNGFLIPAGPLREPMRQIARADLIVLTRVDEGLNIDKITRSIQKHTSVPIFQSKHCPVEWITIPDRQTRDLDFLKGKKALAFSGIGNPVSFERTLQNLGISIADLMRFRDHHWYTTYDQKAIINKAGQCGAQAIVTTEKDAVRFSQNTTWEIPAYYLSIEFQLQQKESDLIKTIQSILNNNPGGSIS
jgi:tetraacyldisaccharide 4'-kinase